jgi:hypothetical protein
MLFIHKLAIHSTLVMQKTCLTHSVLNNTTQVSRRDAQARRVEKPDILLPRYLRSRSRGLSIHPPVPDTRDDDEESEDQDLKDETTQDDVLAHLEAARIFGLHKHTTTTTLNEEAKDVAGNEYLRNPCCSDNRVRRRLGAEDQATEDHVHRSGKEDRCNEDEYGLDDVWRRCRSVAVSSRTGTIADGLELAGLVVDQGNDEMRLTMAPMTNGMQNHVRFLMRRQVCKPNRTANTMPAITPPTSDGVYGQRT